MCYYALLLTRKLKPSSLDLPGEHLAGRTISLAAEFFSLNLLPFIIAHGNPEGHLLPSTWTLEKMSVRRKAMLLFSREAGAAVLASVLLALAWASVSEGSGGGG